MDNPFYKPGAARATQVNRLFATIARRYDRLNDLMSLGLHRRWKRRLVQLAGQPRDVLDLCCGTGDIAGLFTARRVVGVDFTEEMLQIAAARTPRVTWIRADALRLPFADASFDAVTVGYGLRNLANIEHGLREVYRVLRPGGIFLSLDFGKPESKLWRWCYFTFLRTTVPVMGRAFCGDWHAYSYILTSLENYPAQRGVQHLMEQCGYTDCGFEESWDGAMAINFGRKKPANQ